MKRLYYIRHGQSEMNVLSLFAGRTDTPLTKEGRDGALQAGRNNKGIDIDVIIASPLSRAHDTARLFAEGAGLPEDIIQINELLLERDFGSLENTRWTAEVSRNLFNDNLPDGVETWDVMIARARQLSCWLAMVASAVPYVVLSNQMLMFMPAYLTASSFAGCKRLLNESFPVVPEMGQDT